MMDLNMKKLFFPLIILVVLLICFSCRETKINDITNKINIGNIMETITYLSSKELNGRLPGTDGLKKSSKYLSNKLSEYSISKVIDDSYFQDFPIEYCNLKTPFKISLIDKSEKEVQLAIGKDYAVRGFSGSGHFVSDIVFCGYGYINHKEHYNDFEGIDLKDKTVALIMSPPIWKNYSLTERLNFRPRPQTEKIKKLGGKGVIFLTDPNSKWDHDPPIKSVFHGPGKYIDDVPQIQLSHKTAEWLFKQGHTGNKPEFLSLEKILKEIKNSKHPLSFKLNTKIKFELDMEYKDSVITKNVIGIIHATSKNSKNDEYIVVGAHYDHVGSFGKALYYPGANDNASGVAVIMEAARVLKQIPLKRNIIFILFSGEEQGLFGSKYFVKHPPVPLKKIKCMINLDCVGGSDKLIIGGGEKYTKLYDLCLEQKPHSDIVIEKKTKPGGADTKPFEDNNIPNIYFGNSYEGYYNIHRPQDTVKNINKITVTKTAKLLINAIYDIAELDEIPID